MQPGLKCEVTPSKYFLHMPSLLFKKVLVGLENYASIISVCPQCEVREISIKNKSLLLTGIQPHILLISKSSLHTKMIFLSYMLIFLPFPIHFFL